MGRLLRSSGPPAVGSYGICQLGEGTTLGPEAVIDNIRGHPECITLGRNSYCRGRLLTYGHSGRIKIGDWCYIGVRSEIWSMDSIEIGNRVLIAHDVNIHDGTAHSLDPAERHAHFRHIMEQGHPTDAKDLPGIYSSPVVIEDDVWISFGVTILRGVRIGAGSVIAAGSLVTDDVPAGVIYRNSVTPVIQPLPAR
jgi:acetyltransferase-like isoleucine patch superfamily enzyme